MNVDKWVRYWTRPLHVMHGFSRSSSFDTRMLVGGTVGNLSHFQSRTWDKAGGRTSTVPWTTPRSPYVMHGGYSVIQVELLHE